MDAIKKKTIAENKLSGWKKICNTFNRTTPLAKIWNYIKIFKDRKMNRCYNDEFIVPLLDKLADNGNFVANNLDSFFNTNNDNERPMFLIEKFSFNEFHMSLLSRKDTTPGLDNLPFMLIRNLDPSVQKTFLDILNAL